MEDDESQAMDGGLGLEDSLLGNLIDTDNEETEAELTTFDISLPTRHEYLGNDLEELRGRTYHEEGAIIKLPILFELGIVLVPNQTLPLTVFYPATIRMLRKAIKKDGTFGIVCLKKTDKEPNKIGTTAEIYQYLDDNAIAGFKVKATGRQRFKLLETKTKSSGIIYGTVQILPEVLLPAPMNEARLPSLNRMRQNKNFGKTCGVLDMCGTRWPKWVLDGHDPELLAKKVTEQLYALKFVSKICVPSDPVTLSFWVLQCLPMNNDERVRLLGLNSCVERLQGALKVIATCEAINCKMCGTRLAWRNNVFVMSADGPSGTYVNPYGYVHEILTLYSANGLKVSEEPPNTDSTWFPGYGWQIAQCSRCLVHSGWVFTAETSRLNPRMFYGLARRSISMQSEAQQTPPPLPNALEDFYANA